MLLHVRDLGNIVNSASPRQRQLAFPPLGLLVFPVAPGFLQKLDWGCEKGMRGSH